MAVHKKKSESVKTSVAEPTSNPVSQGSKALKFEDNRSEAVVQKKLQGLANNSLHANHVGQLQAMANTYSTPQRPIQKKASPQTNSMENKTGHPLQTGKAVVQRIGDEIEMETIKPRIPTCVCQGVQHEGGESYSSVVSKVTQLQETDQVIYEIAWDAAVAPVGHDGMVVAANVASDFVVDKSQDGKSIGESRAHYKKDGDNGWVFEFRDGINWPAELNGGTWRFRLRVINGAGTEVAISPIAVVDWNH